MEIIIDVIGGLFRKKRYPVYINREQTLLAKIKGGWRYKSIQIFQENKPCHLIEVKRKHLFKPNFILNFGNGVIGTTETKNFWKGYYHGEIAGDDYEIYKHFGYKISIFRDGKQIAWWDKGQGSFFRSDYYKIISDDNADRIVLITLCLLFGDWSYNDATIDFGNIVPGIRTFDENWEPDQKAVWANVGRRTEVAGQTTIAFCKAV